MKVLVFVVAVLVSACGRDSFLSLDVEAPPNRPRLCDSGVMEDTSPYVPDPPAEDVVDAGASD